MQKFLLGHKYLKGLQFEQVFIAIIVLVAMFFRFWHGFTLWSYDELSALYRLQFPDLKSLIQNGVTPDGHPVLTHIILFTIKKWFGVSIFAFRLPFILLGILSVYLVYALANLILFSKAQANIAASIMATTQLTVYHSQVARPYALGMALVLVLAIFTVKFCKKPTLYYSLVVGVLAAFCGYTHYFAALQAVLVLLLAAYFLIRKKRFTYFLFVIIFGALLFSPHLLITIKQLSYGGLAWLGKPNAYFFINYFSYLVAFSWEVGGGLLLILLASWWIAAFKSNQIPWQPTLLLLVLGLLPLVVGFLYSVFRAPVLQFPVLLFGFPFLSLAFASLFPAQLNNYWSILVLIVCSYGTFVKREHATVMQLHALDASAKLMQASLQNTTDSLVLFAPYNPDYYRFLVPKEMLLRAKLLSSFEGNEDAIAYADKKTVIAFDLSPSIINEISVNRNQLPILFPFLTADVWFWGDTIEIWKNLPPSLALNWQSITSKHNANFRISTNKIDPKKAGPWYSLADTVLNASFLFDSYGFLLCKLDKKVQETALIAQLCNNTICPNYFETNIDSSNKTILYLYKTENQPEVETLKILLKMQSEQHAISPNLYWLAYRKNAYRYATIEKIAF